MNLTRLQDTVLTVRGVRVEFFDLSLCYCHGARIRNCHFVTHRDTKCQKQMAALLSTLQCHLSVIPCRPSPKN